jgi:hypothetical protein
MEIKTKAMAEVVVLLVVLLLLPGVSHALTDNQKALVGLMGVNIDIAEMDSDAERLGLTRDQLQTDVELRLRKAGVRMLTEKERRETPGGPRLYVSVAISSGANSPIAAYSIIVALTEWVTLDRDLRTIGTIWEIGFVRTVLKKDIRELRRDLGDMVDKFINDYLAANPK